MSIEFSLSESFSCRA